MTAVHLVCISPKLAQVSLVAPDERNMHAQARKKIFKKHMAELSKSKPNAVDANGKKIVKAKEAMVFEKLWKANPNTFELLLFTELFQGAARRNERLNVNCRDRYQRTPLAYATREGRFIIASRLVYEKAEVNLP